MDEIIYKPIGIIHSPFKTPENVPIQHTGAKGERGTIEIYPEFTEGLADLQGFSHIMLLFHMHKVEFHKLKVIPFSRYSGKRCFFYPRSGSSQSHWINGSETHQYRRKHNYC
jgi:tRNA (Thr-GGU) A37 N-methylase